MEHEKQPEHEPEHEPDPDPGPGPDPEPGLGHEAQPTAAARPRRRGRTRRALLLIACAAVLGAGAGTVAGYVVQYDREPTPLPPLSQPDLRDYKPVPAAKGASARSINEHRHVKTDGDLRRLLLKKPSGAQRVEASFTTHGWLSLSEYATDFEYPDDAFETLAAGDFRRAVTTSWQEREELYVTINLVQFHDEEFAMTPGYAKQQLSDLSEPHSAGNDGVPIPGSGTGRIYLADEPVVEPGYEPLYKGWAAARRGDVFMEIFAVDNTRPVSEKDLMSLAKRQLERL
ncbi:hypothetical protein ACX6XY_05195 [Streptomyces sp. O3]